jgi:hypothetical protein
MTPILLTPEQYGVLTNATEPVAICLPDGTVAGYLPPSRTSYRREPTFTPEEIAAAERKIDSPGPCYTTPQLLERLRAVGQE